MTAKVVELEAIAKKERDAKLKEAEEERKKKIDEMAERQRQREAEIDAKMHAEKEQGIGGVLLDLML